MTSLLDEGAVFSPVWWEDLNTSLKIIDKNLKALDSQFRRCYAYRTATHRPEDGEQLRRGFYMISNIRKDIAPLIKWSENSASLGLDTLSESERSFTRTLMNRIQVYTAPAYRSWMISLSDWENMNFHLSMNKIVVNNQLLNSVAKGHVETSAKDVIKEMTTIRTAWTHVWSK